MKGIDVNAALGTAEGMSTFEGIKSLGSSVCGTALRGAPSKGTALEVTALGAAALGGVALSGTPVRVDGRVGRALPLTSDRVAARSLCCPLSSLFSVHSAA